MDTVLGRSRKAIRALFCALLLPVSFIPLSDALGDERGPNRLIAGAALRADAGSVGVSSSAATFGAKVPFHGEGVIEVIHIDKFEDGKTESRYFLNTGRQRFELRFAGRHSHASAGSRVRIRGHIENSTILADPTTQGAVEVMAAAPSERMVGERKMLAVLLNFLDSPPPPFTRREAREKIFNGGMQRFYQETSYSQVSWTGDVIGWYTIPRNGEVDFWGCTLPEFLGYSYRDEVYRLIRDDVDVTQYEYIVMFVNHPCVTGGVGSIGKLGTILRLSPYQEHRHALAWVGSLDTHSATWGWSPSWTKFDMILSHELGHNLGAWHANSWACDGEILYGTDCQHIEYGNLYDIMGYGWYGLNFNARYKDQFGWLDPSSVLDISSPGRYTLRPLSSGSGSRTARFITSASPEAPFYLEYRKAVGVDSALNNPLLAGNQEGLMINWVPDFAPFSRLLEMSPESEWSDVALKPGATFRDPGRGIGVSVVSADDATITFDVSMAEPLCARNSVSAPNYGPTRVELPPWRDGQALFWWYSVRNEDSPLCGSSNVEVAVTTPSGWWDRQWFDPTEFSLDPGRAASVALLLRLPPLDPGTYEVVFTATNTTAGGLSTTVGRTVVVVPLPAPANLSPQVFALPDASGAVTLSWDPIPGASHYAVRANDNTDGAIRYAGNDCPGDPHYLCVTVTATSVTMPVQAGRSYTWWVHAIRGHQWSDLAAAGFIVLSNSRSSGPWRASVGSGISGLVRRD